MVGSGSGDDGDIGGGADAEVCARLRAVDVRDVVYLVLPRQRRVLGEALDDGRDVDLALGRLRGGGWERGKEGERTREGMRERIGDMQALRRISSR